MPGDDYSVSLSRRLVSACIGSLAVSVLMTPLDVIKIRMQVLSPFQYLLLFFFELCFSSGDVLQCLNTVQRHNRTLKGKSLFHFLCFYFIPIINNSHLQKKPKGLPNPRIMSTPRNQPLNTLRLAAQLVKQDGFLILWSGLRPTLVMSIPSNVLYFAAYDSIKAYLDHLAPDRLVHIVPLISGGGARMVAATLVSPIELVRTQMQSNLKIQSIGFVTQLRHLLTSPQGYLAIFRGLTPTLQRDIPFSGIYWMVYENVNRQMTTYTDTNAPLRSFISGATGGMVAAFLTTPFDVAKTHIQIHRAIDVGKCHEKVPDTLTVLRRLWLDRRLRGLFAGFCLNPREREKKKRNDEITHNSSTLLLHYLLQRLKLIHTQREANFETRKREVEEMIDFTFSSFLFLFFPTGVVPRCARIAPSCAIMISTYEFCKIHLTSHDEYAS